MWLRLRGAQDNLFSMQDDEIKMAQLYGQLGEHADVIIDTAVAFGVLWIIWMVLAIFLVFGVLCCARRD